MCEVYQRLPILNVSQELGLPYSQYFNSICFKLLRDNFFFDELTYEDWYSLDFKEMVLILRIHKSDISHERVSNVQKIKRSNANNILKSYIPIEVWRQIKNENYYELQSRPSRYDIYDILITYFKEQSPEYITMSDIDRDILQTVMNTDRYLDIYSTIEILLKLQDVDEIVMNLEEKRKNDTLPENCIHYREIIHEQIYKIAQKSNWNILDLLSTYDNSVISFIFNQSDEHQFNSIHKILKEKALEQMVVVGKDEVFLNDKMMICNPLLIDYYGQKMTKIFWDNGIAHEITFHRDIDKPMYYIFCCDSSNNGGITRSFFDYLYNNYFFGKKPMKKYYLKEKIYKHNREGYVSFEFLDTVSYIQQVHIIHTLIIPDIIHLMKDFHSYVLRTIGSSDFAMYHQQQPDGKYQRECIET